MPNASIYENFIRNLGQRLALASAIIGWLVLLGWVWGVPWLTQPHADWASMKVNTAIGFVLAGSTLYVRHHSKRITPIYRISAVMLLLLGLLTLIEYSLRIDLGIDHWLFPDVIGNTTADSGRMSPASAVCFLLMGLALLFEGRDSMICKRAVSWLTLSTALIAAFTIIGYSYQVKSLYQLSTFSNMGLHTAFVFFALSFSALSLIHDHPLMRVLATPKATSLLPIILLVPVLGWLRLEGQQRWGLYDTNFGTALLILLIILLWSVLVIRSVMTINQQDAHIQNQNLRQESILTSMGEGVVMVDTNMVFQVFNPAAKDMLGVGITSAQHSEWNEIYGVFHPDTMQMYQPEEYPLVNALNGVHTNDEVQFIRNNQRPQGVYINVSARPIRDDQGDIVGAVAVLHDITEQRLASEALAQAANYERSLSASLVLFNAGFEQEQTLTTLLQQLSTNHPLPVSAFYSYRPENNAYQLSANHNTPASLAQALPAEAPLLAGLVDTGNRSMLLSDNLTDICTMLGLMIVPASLLICPVNYNSQKLGILVLASTSLLNERDMTFIERLASQLAIALANINHRRELKTLNETLRHYSEEIAHQNQQLEHASKMKSEFLANMSHELRTPLNAIIGFSEVLKDGLVGELSEDQASYVTEVFDSGEHLLSLINDILDLSKVEAGMMTLDSSSVDVSGLLQGSLSVIKEKALKHRITLTIDLTRAPNHIFADARKIKQIIYNLLSNAIKFTPEKGEIRLTARTVGRNERQLIIPDMVVYQLPAPENDWPQFLEIQVHDNGIGINATDLHRLFQAFSQIDTSLSRQFTGTGLGLELVRRMTELHGGSVAVASAPGLGSCFTVWLPVRETELTSAQETSVATSPIIQPHNTLTHPSLTGQLALIIENNHQATEILRHHLESAGFTVMSAVDAEQGLAIIAKTSPDLITLDLLLPGLDGWDMLERIKADQRLAGVPVVIVSIVAESSNGIAMGAAKVLQKPLRREDLLNTLYELGLVSLNQTIAPQFSLLAVDDDPKALKLIDTYLAPEKSFTLLHANNGAEAIASINEALPDLLILDLMMPDMNGFDIVAHLKNMPNTADLPIVVLTAKDVSDEEREQLNGKVWKIMKKSQFDGQSFLNEVRRALLGAKK